MSRSLSPQCIQMMEIHMNTDSSTDVVYYLPDTKSSLQYCYDALREIGGTYDLCDDHELSLHAEYFR